MSSIEFDCNALQNYIFLNLFSVKLKVNQDEKRKEGGKMPITS